MERIEIFQNRVTVRNADVGPDYIVYEREKVGIGPASALNTLKLFFSIFRL